MLAVSWHPGNWLVRGAPDKRSIADRPDQIANTAVDCRQVEGSQYKRTSSLQAVPLLLLLLFGNTGASYSLTNRGEFSKLLALLRLSTGIPYVAERRAIQLVRNPSYNKQQCTGSLPSLRIRYGALRTVQLYE